MGLGREQHQLYQWPSAGPELERSSFTQQATVPLSVLLGRAELAFGVASAGLAPLDSRGKTTLPQRGCNFTLVFIFILFHFLQHAAKLQFQLPHPLQPSRDAVSSVLHSRDFRPAPPTLLFSREDLPG